MRLVLDTNVLVSALLKVGSVPDRALEAVWSTGAVVLYDSRIAAEYREVLTRPKFRGIDPLRIETLLARFPAEGALAHVSVLDLALPDEADRCFVEVARSGRADALVTGNLRDFPDDLGFAVWPPATLLAQLE